MRHTTGEDRIVDTVVYISVTLFAMICLYPLIYCLSMSFSGDNAILSASVRLFPRDFNLESYKMVLTKQEFWRSLGNSAFYTVSCSVWQVFCTFQLGYVCTRKEFIFKKFLDTYLIIPMFFSGGLIPLFLLMRSLGLYNNVWAIIIPTGVSIWNSILVKTFIRSNIPDELIDSAHIDGANEFQILYLIVVPLSTTIIAIIGMYAAVGAWNDYFSALIYLQNEKLHPLQLYLKKVMNSGMQELSYGDAEALVRNMVQNQRIRYVLIVVATLPVLIFYPFIQKYFVKGVMLGSIKG